MDLCDADCAGRRPVCQAECIVNFEDGSRVRNYTLPDTRSSTADARLQRRWHAVGIVGTAHACAAAQACKGGRYLSVDAPRLPLAGCDASICDCTYQHFPDRRHESRREDDPPTAVSTKSSGERRGGRGRRSTDRGRVPAP